MNWTRFLLLGGIVLLVACERLLPHPWNVTPIGALALFAGATYADRRLALAIPLVALLLGDLFTGLHILIGVVYASFALNVLLGRWLRGRRRPLPIAAITLIGAIQFFLITNFASWLAFYPHTIDGLITCYVAAVPYFLNTLLGDVVFVTVLFGGFALVEARFPAVRERMEASVA